MKNIFIYFFLMASLLCLAQTDPIPDNQANRFWDHVRFGGGLGLSFGNDITVINVSPSAIYDFQNNFALGIGLGYLYSKNGDFRSNVISPGLIALYNPANELQLSAEFEQLFVNQKLGNESFSYDYPALYLGVAYRTGFASFGIRYDALYDERDSIFASPWSPIIRVYF
ncbi:MAG: alpha-ketoglutarate decarboxylase [Flavobacteriaceae bacterium]|nr:alpha-ketoglutarate decarboxylase [Flavobacteriaceae bacterium]